MNENPNLLVQHTQTPNVYIDQVMPVIKPADFCLLMVLVRQVFGWHKGPKHWEPISLSQFMSKTGMAKGTVKSGLKRLVDMGIIETVPSNGRTISKYRINFSYRPPETKEEPADDEPGELIKEPQKKKEKLPEELNLIPQANVKKTIGVLDPQTVKDSIPETVNTDHEFYLAQQAIFNFAYLYMNGARQALVWDGHNARWNKAMKKMREHSRAASDNENGMAFEFWKVKFKAYWDKFKTSDYLQKVGFSPEQMWLNWNSFGDFRTGTGPIEDDGESIFNRIVRNGQ